MKYTYPDYYKEFTCIADRCKDTCCAGWQIVIDDKTLNHYSCLGDSHPFKERLESSIDWDEEVFKQDKCKRCAFLNRENLCDLYTVLGSESLCHTCATYPRHIEEFEDLREVTLSLSCPEVARILMEKISKVTFYEEETDEVEDYDAYEDFDELMFGILQDIRSDMIEVIQDRALSIKHRAVAIWKMAEDIQSCIDEGNIFGCGENLASYRHKEEVKSFIDNYTLDMSKSLDMFRILYNLEILDEAWEHQVDETALLLYGNDKECYKAIYDEFSRWLDENMIIWHVMAEQIMVYFISTYLCGAVYDGWIASKAKMSVVSVFFIHEMIMARWIKQGKNLVFEDIVDVVYRYSRELEHSDINLDEMEQCLA